MRKRFLRRLSFTSLLGAVLATFLLVVVQVEFERRNLSAALNARLERVAERLERNRQEIVEIKAVIAQDYLDRARSVSIIIGAEAKPDTAWLRALSRRLDIDEIHVVDENGFIVAGTNPEYLGMDMSTTAQTAAFMPVVRGETPELAQEPMPRGYEGVLFQYVGVARDDGEPGMVQIGMRPDRLEELLVASDLDHALRGVIVGREGYAIALDPDAAIVWHPDEALIGRPLAVHTGYISLNGVSLYAEAARTSEYILVAVAPVSEIYAGLVSYTILYFCLTLLIFAAVAVSVGRFIDSDIVSVIKKTIGTLNDVSNGDFSVRAEVIGDTETARLAEGINFMLAHINRRYEEQEALISELARAREAADAANQAKTVFLENMGHEIRTPMNGVIGYIELALAEEENPDSRDYLERIQLCATGLLEILNNILDVAQIEGKRLTLEEVDFDMERVFSVCDQIMRPRFEEKGVSFSASAPGISGVSLYGDPTRLRQVLLNLLSNALKFTDDGRVEMSARLLDQGDDFATLRFEVWDTGIGMNDEQMRRSFEAFTQGDGSSTRRFGGIGLGLSITKSIVELMGGELTATSAPGRGSMFCFTLRFEKAKQPGKAAAEPPRPMFKGRVLVVEDNATNRLIITGHLNKLGLRVVNAENGLEGLTAHKRWTDAGDPFDAILMDVQMPLMDGLSAARQLREEGCQIPIVALTASSTYADKQKCAEAGMTDFLAKPFTGQDLWTCLLKYLRPVSMAPAAAPPHAASPPPAVLDKERGIAFTAGDESMYEQVLADFYHDNKHAADEISAFLKEGRPADARRRAHTIKGNAGMIGAFLLHAAAAALETEIADAINSGRRPPYDDLAVAEIAAFRVRLDEALELLGQMDLACRKRRYAQGDGNFDKAKAAGLAARLAPLIAMGDAACASMQEEISSAFAGVPENLCDSLIERLENYDFGEAAETLRRIEGFIDESSPPCKIKRQSFKMPRQRP